MPKDRSFEKFGMESKDKAVVELLEEMNDKLARIIDLLEGQGRVRPS
jgi:hypothetical protein